MNIGRYLIYIIIALVLPLSSIAQEHQRQIYDEAESEYEIGRIDQAKQLVHNNLKAFDGVLLQNAYRLLALCYLSQDRETEARFYAEQLVRLNNYYNSADDPARFRDLVNQLKQGITTTITTASSQSETINEAPVPITIITAEMIEELGYNRNLNQILAAYVPGIAEITSDEATLNLTMHGAYATGQELILIMENGHRLNTRFDNIGPTSYSVSTEKIDHIEVLRGPASSLYGNVAVSAVVNIITKSGRSIDGVKAKYGYGSFNTHKADILIGTQFMDADLLAWASFYNSDGQLRHFGDGEGYIKPTTERFMDEDYRTYYYNPDRIYVDGYKDSPSYDVGLTFRLKGFDLMFSRKNVKRVQECTTIYGGYDYDRYSPIYGIKPGYQMESTHAEISYSRTLRNIRLNGTVYSDWSNASNYTVDFDSLVRITPLVDNETYETIYDDQGNKVLERKEEVGSWDFRQFREHTIGGSFRAGTDYQFGSMKGSALAGVQYEHFSLVSGSYLRGAKFQNVEGGGFDFKRVTSAGNENSLSFSLQDKHYLTPQLILNAGCRLDFKYRQQEDVVRTFSPRLALMYVPSDRFSLKLSYSEAFADLSFYMRYLSGGDDDYTLEPQHLSAVQLSAMGSVPSLHINYEVNLFYNHYTNLLCWQPRDFDLLDEDLGKNVGELKNVGIEATANYAFKRLSSSLSFYYCIDTDSKHYYYNSIEKMVNNVPHLTINLHGAYHVLQSTAHQLKVYGHASYTGRQLNYTHYNQTEDFFVDSRLLIGLGIQYRYRQHLQFSLDCENIFNTDHYICGPNYQSRPHIQRGRTLMASVACQF